MSRSTFLKLSALGIAGIGTEGILSPSVFKRAHSQDDAFLKRVITHSDRAVERYVNSLSSYAERHYLRPLSDAFATFTAAYCHPDSAYHKSEALLASMDEVLTMLLEAQYADGTLDSGGNRQSPPDTGFYLEKMCPAASVIRETGIRETDRVEWKLLTFLQRAGEGIRTGGVHTPNHRWVIAAVLAHLYTLFDDEKYIRRMDEWLAEGIYQNADGNYPERSRNYALVENRSFLTIGRLLNRPHLFDIVKKNLEATYYYLEPNGDLITIDSRRQDQNYPIEMSRYYFQYKYLAVQLEHDLFAAIAKDIEEYGGFDRHVLSKLLVFMEEPALLTALPAEGTSPTEYTKELPGSSLVRLRRGSTTASIFAGNDKPITIASGRSNNPTFFTFRKGDAVLESVRLSTAFFNTGYVRGDGVQRQGNQYTLTERKEAYYYHPMPDEKKEEDGGYTLTPSLDGRFWSKMDFDSRPKDTIPLDSKIVITEDADAFQLDIDVEGPENVRVTIELKFSSGGVLEGVTQAGREDDYFLEEGMATYKNGSDVITIGPGLHQHAVIRGLDGEMYSTHFGTIKGTGMHVYLTGLTPFSHSMRIS